MKFRQFKAISKVCASAALALSLCLPMAANVFAATNENGKGAVVSDDETSVSAALTKVLEMGEGTAVPNAQFTFTFTQVTNVDKVQNAEGTETPIQTKAVPIKNVTVDVNGKTGTDKQDRKKIVEVQSDNFLAKADDNANYTEAGVYVYDVVEQADTYAISPENAKNEKMTYSKASYRMFVYVANKADGSGVYIKGVGVVQVKTDKGTDNEKQGTAAKVDPTPNPTPKEDGSVDGNNSKMKFTNTYLKKNGTNIITNEADRNLQISKKVEGSMGNKSMYFDFNVTVKKAAVDEETTVLKGYVIEKVENADKVVTADANVADTALIKEDEQGKYIEFKLDGDGSKTQVVKLKHGQELAFGTDASVGTSFRAVETAVASYTPSLVVKANNETIADDQKTDTDSGERTVGETRENSARFTNTYEDVTETGIIMNNLSFVMLIVVAVAAVAAMLVLKNRRRA